MEPEGEDTTGFAKIEEEDAERHDSKDLVFN